MQGVLISHFNHSFLLQRYDMFIVVAFLRLAASTVLRASDAASGDAAGLGGEASSDHPSDPSRRVSSIHNDTQHQVGQAELFASIKIRFTVRSLALAAAVAGLFRATATILEFSPRWVLFWTYCQVFFFRNCDRPTP